MPSGGDLLCKKNVKEQRSGHHQTLWHYACLKFE